MDVAGAAIMAEAAAAAMVSGGAPLFALLTLLKHAAWHLNTLIGRLHWWKLSWLHSRVLCT